MRARYYNPQNGQFSSEDPIRSGLNWYTYCGGNPIRYIDPSGLIYVMGSDGVAKELDLGSDVYVSGGDGKTSKLNTDSFAVRGSDSIYFYDHGQIITNAFTVKQTDKYINVYAYFNITGDAADTSIGSTTYRQAAINGIISDWSGVYNNINVSVFCVEVNSGQSSLSMSINNVIGADSISHANFGLMTLFIGDGRVGLDHRYSLDDFRSTAAHEFGHAGFHVWDAYNDDKITTKFPSIMNYQFGLGGAQAIDYAIIFGNQTWKSNSWVYYSSYPDILDKYAPGWNK